MRWETVVGTFERLSAVYTDEVLRKELVAAVEKLESIEVTDLAALLEQVGRGTATRGTRRAA
jgi:hypothetical protein